MRHASVVAADRAVGRGFTGAMQTSMWFEIGVLLVSLVLMLVLWRKLLHHEKQYEPEPVRALVAER